MKPCALLLCLVACLPSSLCAGSPKPVVITDDRVTIGNSVVAFREPHREFQISRDRIVALFGTPTTCNKSWFTSDCGWENFGISLQYRDDIQRCTSLRFDVGHARYLATFRHPYTGPISVNSIPITPLTDAKVFLKIGFRKSPYGYARTIGPRETELWVDAAGHIVRVSIILPKIFDNAID